jgi:hypothetical protein
MCDRPGRWWGGDHGRARVPGGYAMLDHAIFRTAKGAMGLFNVTGPLRPDIYSGTEPYDTTAEMRIHGVSADSMAA